MTFKFENTSRRIGSKKTPNHVNLVEAAGLSFRNRLNKAMYAAANSAVWQ